MKVIPSINCPDFACVQKKIEVAKTFLHDGDLLHLDVTDGSFATHKTWSDPSKWGSLQSPFGLEVHLMVDRPELYVDNWLAAGARRLIVHAETLTPQTLNEMLSAAERYQAEMMLSSKPESSLDELAPYIKHFTVFQVLAVQPGPVNQTFLPFVCEKISFLREEAQDATIEVDGGMNLETARMVRDLGADTIVSAHYIFAAADPKKAYEELTNI